MSTNDKKAVARIHDYETGTNVEMNVDDANVSDLERTIVNALQAAYYPDLSDLEEYIRKSLRLAYYRGHTDGLIKADKLHKANDAVEEAYNNGLQDAWECAKKIACSNENGGYFFEELHNIFDKRCVSLHKISENYSVQEVVSRIKDYEKKKIDDIKVGDEVYYTDENHPRVVTAIYRENESFGGDLKAVQITESGKYVVDNAVDLHRNGKHHVGITEILNSLKGE